MKKFRGITVLLLLLSLFSCVDKEKPKVIYEEDIASARKAPRKIDTAKIKIADLPILMEETKYLIHPVGDVRVYESFSKYGSSKLNNVSYAISNYNRFEIVGYFNNLMFQHIDSTSIYPLTDKNIQIKSATYLNTVAQKIKKGILVYNVVDADTNRDGKINSSDIETLYISFIDGTRFTKLSEDLEQLLDWSVVDEKNRLYFRTIKDVNKNGAFDSNDSVKYFYVNLNNEEWIVEEYNPI